MDEKTAISINTYVKYPSQEIYRKLKVLAAERDIPLGELIGEIIEYILEDQNRLQEVLARLEQKNGNKQ